MRCFAAVPNVIFAIPFCRRTLIVGALSVALAGCACFAPPQVATDGCVSPGCLRRTAAVEAPVELRPAPRPAKPKVKSATAAKRSKSTTVATKLEKQSPAPRFAPAGTSEEKAESSKTMTPQSAPSGQPSAATTTTTVGTKMDAPVSGQPSETSDSILNKAKATIAAKMENAAAVEFVDAKRAIRKNTLGQPIDSICGHVKGKNQSGEEIGARQFLYLVKEDEAYVVNGNPESVPATAYRNICANEDSRIDSGTTPRIGSPEWKKEQAESESREQRLKSIINGICRGC
jgi:hypothetical protein